MDAQTFANVQTAKFFSMLCPSPLETHVPKKRILIRMLTALQDQHRPASTSVTLSFQLQPDNEIETCSVKLHPRSLFITKLQTSEHRAPKIPRA